MNFLNVNSLFYQVLISHTIQLVFTFVKKLLSKLTAVYLFQTNVSPPNIICIIYINQLSLLIEVHLYY